MSLFRTFGRSGIGSFGGFADFLVFDVFVGFWGGPRGWSDGAASLKGIDGGRGRGRDNYEASRGGRRVDWWSGI
jgi:hypothetical protein